MMLCDKDQRVINVDVDEVENILHSVEKKYRVDIFPKGLHRPKSRCAWNQRLQVSYQLKTAIGEGSDEPSSRQQHEANPRFIFGSPGWKKAVFRNKAEIFLLQKKEDMKKKLELLESEVASQKEQNAKLVNRINDLESKIRLNDFDDR